MSRFTVEITETDPTIELLVSSLPVGAAFNRAGYQPLSDVPPTFFDLGARERSAMLRDQGASPALPGWRPFAEWLRSRLIERAFARATGQSGNQEVRVEDALARLAHVIDGGDPLPVAAVGDAVGLWERCQRELPAVTIPEEILALTRSRGARGCWLGRRLLLEQVLGFRVKDVPSLREAVQRQLELADWRPLRELAEVQTQTSVGTGPDARVLEARLLEKLIRGRTRGSVAPFEKITITLCSRNRVRTAVALPEHIAETVVPHPSGGRCHVHWPCSEAGFEFELGGSTTLVLRPLVWDRHYEYHPTVKWEGHVGRVCIDNSASVIGGALESRGVTDAGVRIAETLLTLRNAMVYGVVANQRYHHSYDGSDLNMMSVLAAHEAHDLAQLRKIEIVRWQG